MQRKRTENMVSSLLILDFGVKFYSIFFHLYQTQQTPTNPKIETTGFQVNISKKPAKNDGLYNKQEYVSPTSGHTSPIFWQHIY